MRDLHILRVRDGGGEVKDSGLSEAPRPLPVRLRVPRLALDGGGAFGVAGDLGGAGFGEGRGTEQSAGIVEDDANGHGLEERAHAALVEESLAEGPGLKGLEDLGGDASAEVDASCGEDLQGDVAGLGSEGGGEHLHGLEADGAGTILCAGADDGVWILGGEAVAEPGGLLHLLVVAEKGVDVLDAEAGDDALEADAAVEGSTEVLEEGDLAIVAGREVAVAALGGDRRMAAQVWIPDEQGFSETGAGGDEAAVTDGGGVGLV